MSPSRGVLLEACFSARQRTEQRSRHAAGAPVAVAAAYLHPNPAGGMVRLTKESNPFDGISDGVIKGVVLTVELTVGLAAAVNEAVAALSMNSMEFP